MIAIDECVEVEFLDERPAAAVDSTGKVSPPLMDAATCPLTPVFHMKTFAQLAAGEGKSSLFSMRISKTNLTYVLEGSISKNNETLRPSASS